MRRMILAVIVILLGAPTVAAGQQAGTVYRIAYLADIFSSAESDYFLSELKSSLHELGYIENQTVIIEARYAQEGARLRSAAAELVALKPHLLFAARARALVVLQETTKTIPIVFTAAPAEFVTEANVTGVAWNLFPEPTETQLRLLKELNHSHSRVGALWISPPNLKTFALQSRQSEERVGVRLIAVVMYEPKYLVREHLDSAFNSLINLNGVTALMVHDHSFTAVHRKDVVQAAARHRLPTIYSSRESTLAGGLISYGTRFGDHVRMAAMYIDKILKGTKPAELPVGQISKFELVINLKTATALGLTIPPSLLLRADQVIE